MRACNSRQAAANASAWLSPSIAAGSGIPQWALAGVPGQIGQTSPAALSQTVMTRSSGGAPAAANSSQLCERKPSVECPRSASSFRAARMHFALRETAGGQGAEAASAFLVEDCLREDRARAVPGAQEQDVDHAAAFGRQHLSSPRLSESVPSAGLSP